MTPEQGDKIIELLGRLRTQVEWCFWTLILISLGLSAIVVAIPSSIEDAEPMKCKFVHVESTP